jgi:hypothetical protein
MPAQTTCIKCGVTGFVRWEHIATGTRTIIEYSCGKCEHVWSVHDRREPGREPLSRRAKRDEPGGRRRHD